MGDHRNDGDARLQRLANLSIVIRMLKTRVRAAFEGHEDGASASHRRDRDALRTTQSDPRCPYCGYTAGLAQVPREYRRYSTLVRCFACQRDASADDWVLAAPHRARSADGALSSGSGSQ